MLLFLVGAIGTFPLFVPAFFLPSYASTIGLSTVTGAGLVASYNLSSAIGRVLFGYMCDSLGALNSLALAIALSGISMIAIWPVSKSLAPLIVFSIINGASNGGFFSVIPSVLGSIWGPQQLPVAFGMTVTGWMGGYLLVGRGSACSMNRASAALAPRWHHKADFLTMSSSIPSHQPRAHPSLGTYSVRLEGPKAVSRPSDPRCFTPVASRSSPWVWLWAFGC